jgi:hypothetical protein
MSKWSPRFLKALLKLQVMWTPDIISCKKINHYLQMHFRPRINFDHLIVYRIPISDLINSQSICVSASIMKPVDEVWKLQLMSDMISLNSLWLSSGPNARTNERTGV